MDFSVCYQAMGFKSAPFSITPDTHLFFPNEGHITALTHMQYGLHTGGFTLIVGEVGLGKTLLCRELLRECPKTVRTAYIFNPMQSITDLLRSIYFDLTGHVPKGESIGQLHNAIYKALLVIAQRGETATIIIDEAHRLNPELLEALRLISNIETEKRKLLSLILVGQPELRKTLSTSKMRPLAQRISVIYTLQPLSFKATKEYINYRLESCRLKGGVRFTNTAMLLTYWYTKGAPRRINQICDRALLAAFNYRTPRITSKLLRKAASEILA